VGIIFSIVTGAATGETTANAGLLACFCFAFAGDGDSGGASDSGEIGGGELSTEVTLLVPVVLPLALLFSPFKRFFNRFPFPPEVLLVVIRLNHPISDFFILYAFGGLFSSNK
jgi:hypothetical protein